MPSIKKTSFAGLNQWEGNEYPKRQDFVDDNAKIDNHLKRLSDFENLKTDHDYTVVENVDGSGLSTITTTIFNSDGSILAKRELKEESDTAMLTTLTISGVTVQYRVTETPAGYERKAVV